MVHASRHKRLFALALVAATDLGLYILPIKGFDAANVALFFSMILTVAVAFSVSAFSHILRIDHLMYKYVVSGVIGIAAGVAAFFVLRSMNLLSMNWVNSTGKVLLILLNLSAVLFLFFVKGDARNRAPKTAEQE